MSRICSVSDMEFNEPEYYHNFRGMINKLTQYHPLAGNLETLKTKSSENDGFPGFPAVTIFPLNTKEH